MQAQNAMKNVSDIWPLAPLQELMLAHALAHPRSELLTVQFHCTISGSLDAAMFRHAWDDVAARHALLRTGFAWEGLKKPLQVVRRTVELPWNEHDWRQQTPTEERKLREMLLRATRAAGFDLTRPPLSRCDLARLSDREWLFVWTCHHLVSDGWCAGIVLREAFERYAELAAGQTDPAAPAPSFADYLKWLTAQDEAAARSFWREQLRGSVGVTPLPIGDASTSGANDGHAACELRLSAIESARLAQRAQAARVGTNALVEAAWAILLARHAACDDVLFGVTVSGRPHEVPHVDTIVGPFANNVLRRAAVSLDEPVMALSKRLNELQVETQPFEHCSLERIAQAAGRRAGRLFDSLVVYENYPLHAVEEFTVANIAVSRVHGTTTSAFPLTLVVLPGREFMLRLLYDRQIYSDEIAARLLDQVAVLLRGIALRPEARVRELALVERGELELLDCLDEQVPSLRVLDAARQPTPLGMPGRLWIAAKPRTAATAIRGGQPRHDCIVDPLDPRGVRMLRDTGYHAARQPDGEIEYLGPAWCRGVECPANEAPVESRETMRIGRTWFDPREVAAILRLCPSIHDATAIGYTDRAGAGRLAAYVVPAANTAMALIQNRNALVIEEARRFLADRVPAAMIPTAWVALDKLPRIATGEIDTALLPPALSPRPDSVHPYVAPRDIWEQRVANVWSQVLGVEPVGVTDSFLELGGHSSLAVALLARMGEEFGRRLPLAALFEEPTVEHLARLLRQAPPAGASNLVAPIRSQGTQAPLFCIHPAGGTVFCYLELAQQLDADVPLYGIQARGIDGTEAPQDSIESMAADYVRAIQSIQPTGAYRLCGWSTGGVIAFEVARQLRDQGDEVALVGLIDAGIPSADRQFDENDLVPLLQMMFPGEDAATLRRLRDLPIDKQVEYFQERAANARILLAGATPHGARAVFDVFEANMRAVVEYRPQPLSAPLLVIRATEQSTPMHADPDLGWGPWAQGGLTTVEVPGGHLTMLEPPAVAKLANVLRPYLSRRGSAVVGHSPAVPEGFCAAT
ncbi:MAG TPA: condensation domain-containing protein [Pirellulales bacterium]|nr:condensation domain-containing protein [Pirellulales bacterium]